MSEPTGTDRDFGLLETMLLEDGKYFLLERHLKRLQHASEYFGYTLRMDEIRQELARIASEYAAGRRRVRLVSDNNGAFSIQHGPIPEPSEGPRIVAAAANPISSDHIFLKHKTTRRAVYEECRGAYSADLYDVLLWNEHGEVTEFTTGNIVVECDNRLWTPPLTCGLLAGTMRAELIDQRIIHERVIRLTELDDAANIWLINSVRGFVKVEMIRQVNEHGTVTG